MGETLWIADCHCFPLALNESELDQYSAVGTPVQSIAVPDHLLSLAAPLQTRQ